MEKGPERQSARFLFSQRPPSVIRINEKNRPDRHITKDGSKFFLTSEPHHISTLNREITGIPEDVK
jgi:hypothetical protein